MFLNIQNDLSCYASNKIAIFNGNLKGIGCVKICDMGDYQFLKDNFILFTN